jgi:ubiquinone/menaquinone biosynthesis C-methylase UbiE
VVDVEQDRPWANGSVDVVTSFFVLEHIQDLQHLSDAVERVLTEMGVWIFTYFPQRKEWTHGQGQDAFKIQLHYHRYEEIEKAMQQA